MSGAGRGPVLAIDTATSAAVVALEQGAGPPAVIAWPAAQRHGEELLLRIERLLEAAMTEPGALGGIVVGLGPGAFTGLRVGLATAKGLAHALRVPIIGCSTALALLTPEEAEVPHGGQALLLPAGPRDRVLVDSRGARLLPAGMEPELDDRTELVAVDLGERAPADAIARGIAAQGRLGATLVRIGALRLDRGDTDDLARLVPEYVSLPRGVARISGSIEWSRDLR